MPMTTVDLPDPPKKAPEPVKVEAPKLASAAASGHPDVEFLLANRSAYESTGNTAKVEEIDAKLAALGFAL